MSNRFPGRKIIKREEANSSIFRPSVSSGIITGRAGGERKLDLKILCA